ncbi:hypothetical protein SO694_000761103 [Aureococcus anophagefferens]|uniref:Uncharacterized protein n=1 Tax=Aureococcus anophagefferens TaxID=44056 RepID=A0ABR1FHW0_AURAN
MNIVTDAPGFAAPFFDQRLARTLGKYSDHRTAVAGVAVVEEAPSLPRARRARDRAAALQGPPARAEDLARRARVARARRSRVVRVREAAGEVHDLVLPADAPASVADDWALG